MRRVAQAILRTYLSRIVALGLGGRQLRREYYVCSVIDGRYQDRNRDEQIRSTAVKLRREGSTEYLLVTDY